MPKLIDWGVRFEFIREAVVRVAARDGGPSVTIASVAAEMQVSGSTLRRTLSSAEILPLLGVEWIARLRRYDRFNQEANLERGTAERVIRALRSELPRDREEVDRERAWASLTAGGVTDRIAKIRDDHHEHLDAVAASVVARLVADQSRSEFEAIRLRALVDGLIAATCRGSITVEQQLAVFDAHLAELAGTATLDGPVSRAGA